ncbi:MAG: hypothetical protein ACTSU2_05020 [Promethearchaeota archaeon]
MLKESEIITPTNMKIDKKQDKSEKKFKVIDKVVFAVGIGLMVFIAVARPF